MSNNIQYKNQQYSPSFNNDTSKQDINNSNSQIGNLSYSKIWTTPRSPEEQNIDTFHQNSNFIISRGFSNSPRVEQTPAMAPPTASTPLMLIGEVKSPANNNISLYNSKSNNNIFINKNSTLNNYANETMNIKNSDIEPKLQNIVSTANLGCPLKLRQIALQAKNAEYNPKRFAAVIMRIKEPKTTALIFSSGKMVCTGAKSEDDSSKASRKYAKIIKKIIYKPFNYLYIK